MAWGGADEQKKEVAAGNANAKDWHDEALKMVQKTVEEYWNECKGSNAPTVAQASCSNNDSTHCPLESEYDRHRRHALEQTAMQVSSGGWKEELRRYLTDMPSDVFKDTDIIVWWTVSVFILLISLHSQSILY